MSCLYNLLNGSRAVLSTSLVLCTTEARLPEDSSQCPMNSDPFQSARQEQALFPAPSEHHTLSASLFGCVFPQPRVFLQMHLLVRPSAALSRELHLPWSPWTFCPLHSESAGLCLDFLSLHSNLEILFGLSEGN